MSAQLSCGVVSLIASPEAMAALKSDGSVFTWGDPAEGGDSSSVSGQICSSVVKVYHTHRGYSSAMAALKSDGSVVAWGSASNGGDTSGVSGQLTGGVTEIFEGERVFAALKSDGSVVAWGDSSNGGDTSLNATKI